MNKNTLILIFIFPFILSSFSPLFSIEVGGHITENTTWTPDNSPYIIIHDIYVDPGVTLTIAPGTIIKLTSAELSEFNHVDNFYWQGGEAEAKMIWVDGRIIAEGTEQDSIIFTRTPDIEYYHWGIIYLSPQSQEICKFKYCKIEYSCMIGIAIGNLLYGEISVDNGKVEIENCLIQNVLHGIYFRNSIHSASIIDNIFKITEEIPISQALPFYIVIYANNIDSVPLIAGNSFYGEIGITFYYPGYYGQIIYNKFYDCTRAIYITGDETTSHNYNMYIYNNRIYDCHNGIKVYDFTQDTVYIKKNEIIGYGDGIYASWSNVNIADNYLDSCSIYMEPSCHGKVYNNIVQNSGYGVRASGYQSVYNNIAVNGNTGLIVTFRNTKCSNNVSINNQYAWGGYFDGYFDNCIFIGNDELTQFGVSGTPHFRNCVLDFEIEEPCIDAGGNIWVDSLSANSLFVDWQNGDFHLIEGSLAIDAGFDTIGYYCPFDLDYNTRIWDGDEDGNIIIDIGPYEFGAPQLGGIYGTVYQTENGEPLDYVLLKINNEPGEFEFSDSSGFFEFRLPAGVYDIYASRVFYDDVVVEDIEVIDGEFTQINFSMEPTVGVDEINPLQEPTVFMNNYPNPFNPSTSISFSIPSDTKVELSIYNIKGQKIKTLINTHKGKGSYNVIWNGTNNSEKLVSSGIYLYKLKAGNKTIVKKMLLLK